MNSWENVDLACLLPVSALDIYKKYKQANGNIDPVYIPTFVYNMTGDVTTVGTINNVIAYLNSLEKC